VFTITRTLINKAYDFAKQYDLYCIFLVKKKEKNLLGVYPVLRQLCYTQAIRSKLDQSKPQANRWQPKEPGAWNLSLYLERRARNLKGKNGLALLQAQTT
jgi:hypothetical protein